MSRCEIISNYTNWFEWCQIGFRSFLKTISCVQDDDDGPLNVWKNHGWPAAKGARRQMVAKKGISRPLDFTDVPWLLNHSYPKSLGSEAVNRRALDNIGVGLSGYTRRLLWLDRIQATKDQPLAQKVKCSNSECRWLCAIL